MFGDKQYFCKYFYNIVKSQKKNLKESIILNNFLNLYHIPLKIYYFTLKFQL